MKIRALDRRSLAIALAFGVATALAGCGSKDEPTATTTAPPAATPAAPAPVPTPVSATDINGFLPDYLAQEILMIDPFQSLDTTGVGQLVDMACKKGRATRKDIKLGICGEHGGDPASIHFCHKVGLDYVSCSPFRVPIARLAAAQAALRAAKK